MNIKVDQGDIEEIGRMLKGIRSSVPQVLSVGINNTLKNVRADSVKRLGVKINLKAARIRKDFTMNKANVNKLQGSVVAKGDPVGLASFIGTKELKSGGVSIKVYKDGKREKLKHAFMAKRHATNHVFERREYGHAKYRPDFPYAALPHKYRYPLERKTGPRIEDTYTRPEIIDPVLENAGERLSINIESRLNFVLDKYK
jgi:hypothetical protein